MVYEVLDRVHPGALLAYSRLVPNPVALVVVLLCASIAGAQSNATAEDSPAVVTKAPVLLQRAEAPFPPDMQAEKRSGTVELEVQVSATGRVTQVDVVRAASPSFDASAVKAVRQFVFSPAEVDGQPSAITIRLTYDFFWKPDTEAPVAPDKSDVVNFRGRLVERGTRVPLPNALVRVGAQEAVSADDGTFEMRGVPEGSQTVVVLAPEYEKYEVSEVFSALARTEVTYFVRKKIYGTFETVVRSKRERREVSQVTLKQEEIRLIPGTNGDAFKVVQNLPGVARAPYGLGLLIVRGGKGWDTKTYVDEAQVPLLFHFGGLFSTYNANLLSDIAFSAGNFNADFGRSIGGLVQGFGRTPSKQGVHGYFDINVVDASALIETPLSQNWSLAVSGRRSYIDAFLPAVLDLIPGATDAVRFTVAPRYFDYQARVEWKPKRGKKRFFLSFFGSSDVLVAAFPNPAFDPEGRAEFGTSIGYNRLLAGYDTALTEHLSFKTRTSIGLDNFGFTLGSDIFANTRSFPALTRNTLTIDIEPLRSVLSVGTDVSFLPYTVSVRSPPVFRPNQVPDPLASRQLVADTSSVMQLEAGVFVDALVRPVDSLKIVAGVRGDYNTVMKQAWVDPRLSVLWNFTDVLAVKAAAGIYHQSPDFRQGQLSAKFGNPALRPEGARQYMVGMEGRFSENISLDLQLYYKDFFQQARATLGAGAGSEVSTAPTDARYTSSGYGRSYGAELLLRHALTKNFFGWIAYSLSRTERDFRGGTKYARSAFDQPHNLVVVASYKLPLDFIVGAKVRWSSGALNTPIVGTVYDVNGNYYFPIQGEPFSRRLPSFFQLDVRVDKRFVFERWMLALYLDVQNATNRQNVEGVLNSYDYSQEAYLSGLPIIPNLGVRGEW